MEDRLELTEPRATAVAVLGTLTEFHQQPLPYDLSALVDLVLAKNPDLLCLDMSLEQWQRQEFGSLPAEYVEALLPLAAQTDMVVAPIGGDQPMPSATAAGWRGRLIQLLRTWLAWLLRAAPGPTALNQGWRHDLGNALYGLTRRLAGREVELAYQQHIEQLVEAMQRVVKDNPGNRILVVTNIQYCHHIRPRLSRQANMMVKTIDEL